MRGNVPTPSHEKSLKSVYNFEIEVWLSRIRKAPIITGAEKFRKKIFKKVGRVRFELTNLGSKANTVTSYVISPLRIE